MDRSKWEYKKLGEVCAPKSDILRANKLFGNDDIIDYVDISSIDNTTHCITQPTSYVFKEAPSRAQQKVEQGDILYSLVRPNLKNVAVVTSQDTEKYVASSGFCVLRGKEIETRYLYHMVLGNTFTNYILGLVSGANYPAVREDDVKGFTFRCPPITDQQRIVAELDCLNEMIAVKQEQLKEFDKLAQSIFYDMFGDPVLNEKGWEIDSMNEVCDGIGDGLHGTPQYDDKGEIAFINGNNLIDGKIVITERTQFVNEGEAKKIYVELNSNTILLSINGTLGKTAIYNNERIVLGKSACYLRLKNCLNVQFVMALMNTNEFVDFLENNSSQSTIKNVGLKAIRNYKMILPPLTLQQQFAEKISAIEAQKELVKQSIAEMQALLDYTMDKYFG